MNPVPAAGGPPPPGHVGRLSLTARITLACVGVALVAAVLSGLAVGRYVAAVDRAEQPTATESLGTDEATTDDAGGTTGGTAGGTLREELRAARDDATLRPAVRVARSVLLSVVVGVLVGTAAGAATARLLTRPMRRTAEAARAMGAGRRDLRVPVEGPPEIADVATSLNELADALARSEDRQRRFLLSVSHELRTPLTAVRGYAESIADGVVTGDDARDAGAVVLAESARLEHLVRDLLDLARLGADDFRLDVVPVDLTRLLDEAAQVWRQRAGARGMRLLVERPDGPLVVRTDGARVRQVLDGLAENAVRVSPADAPLVLSLRTGGTGDPDGTRAVLQVRDGGPGLSGSDYAVAFEPGVLGLRYRDDRPVGVGIGLSLVHGLVQRLGGDIRAGAAPEGGACFTVHLPDAP
ncbi:HAMP domain-containing sensor histidine kinase [Cellulomonas soli]|uniref:Signal transduction histidine-protein kinase/phosphatase MprB n=1 Tax=Cellulomonas soli TaxID=931535 RepID=A0A512PF96_9CELL|nr:HAMP domain-containing sensor histidine kinase [Cellulomonas soli]NYI59333.1 signal transduction histidine kinase [Cellulomonas soli]GEP69879.1 hypothetical protein CSO01_25940 [Cellulomonas soli]